jgi:hypothetical protein
LNEPIRIVDYIIIGESTNIALPCVSKTGRGELADAGGEEVDECGGDDNPRAKIFGRSANSR